MGRNIDINFSIDPRVKALSKDARSLFNYLLINPHSHISGLYYLPPLFMSHETLMTPEEIDVAFEELVKQGLARYDASHELVWVVDMLVIGQFEPKPNSLGNILTGLLKHLASLNGSPLVPAFKARYAPWLQGPSESPSEAPSKGLRRGSEGGKSNSNSKSNSKSKNSARATTRDDAPDDRAPDDARAPETASYPQAEITGNGYHPAKAPPRCKYSDCPEPIAGEESANYCARHAAEARGLERERQKAAAIEAGVLPPDDAGAKAQHLIE